MFRENQMKKILTLFICLISGCSSNPFLDFYNEEPHDSKKLIHCAYKNIKIFETLDLEELIKKYLDNGYIILGSSELNNEYTSIFFALTAAERLNACLIITKSSFLRNEERSYVATVPHTSYTNHSGNIGNISYSGYSSQISFSNEIYHYTVPIFNQVAVFMGKYKEEE